MFLWISVYFSGNNSMLTIRNIRALKILLTLCVVPVFFIVNVEAKSVHSQPQLRAFLVLDVKVVDPVHLQILGYLQVLHHGVLSGSGGIKSTRDPLEISLY